MLCIKLIIDQSIVIRSSKQSIRGYASRVHQQKQKKDYVSCFEIQNLKFDAN